MFDSSWIDLAIGVAFVWFLFSLAVTVVNETLARLFGMRSNQLWAALNQMLDGQHPSKSILDGVGKLFRWKVRPKAPVILPSIPGVAAMPAAVTPSLVSVTQQLYATGAIQGMEPRADDAKRTRISSIPPTVFSQALIELGVRNGGSIAGYISALPDRNPMKAQLAVLWESASGDIKEFRAQTEQWFDGQMTRLSAAYKARLRYLLAIIGIVIAVGGFCFGLRSDSIALVGDLQHDQNFRSVVVDTASTATKQDLVASGCDTEEKRASKSATECQIDGVAKLSKINLILQANAPDPDNGFFDRLGFLASHVWVALGVLVTGVAISFGSTFWFGITRRLVGIRSSSTAGG